MKSKLTNEQYIPLACVTEAKPIDVVGNLFYPSRMSARPFSEHYVNPVPLRLLHAAMGLCTEVGEIAEACEKGGLDEEHIFEEIGDAFWYLAILWDTYPSIFSDTERAVPFHCDGFQHAFYRATTASTRLLDVAKKTLFYGREYSSQELASVFFAAEDSILDICTYFGFDPGEVRAANIRKLASRYGETFTAAAAVNRDIAAEMQALGFEEKS